MADTNIVAIVAFTVYAGIFLGFISAITALVVVMAASGRWTTFDYYETVVDPRDVLQETRHLRKVGYRILSIYESTQHGGRVKVTLEKRTFRPLAWA